MGGTVNKLVLTGFCHPGPQRCCSFSLCDPRLAETFPVAPVAQEQAGEPKQGAEDGRRSEEEQMWSAGRWAARHWKLQVAQGAVDLT